MVPRPPPHPRPGIENCHEAEKIQKNTFGVFFMIFCHRPPIPIPGVSQSSLPGETNIEKNAFGEIFCDLLPLPPHPHPQRQSKFPSGGKNI